MTDIWLVAAERAFDRDATIEGDALLSLRRFFYIGTAAGRPSLGWGATVAGLDHDRDLRATRAWFTQRACGWLPTDIVLRSPLYATEVWLSKRFESDEPERDAVPPRRFL